MTEIYKTKSTNDIHIGDVIRINRDNEEMSVYVYWVETTTSGVEVSVRNIAGGDYSENICLPLDKEIGYLIPS